MWATLQNRAAASLPPPRGTWLRGAEQGALLCALRGIGSTVLRRAAAAPREGGPLSRLAPDGEAPEDTGLSWL